MKLVVIESPFAGKSEDKAEYAAEVAYNLKYLRACMADCFRRGEAPYASHGLYTQDGVLDDTKPEERKLGMEAGFVWGDLAKTRVVYTDLGVSGGMEKGIRRAVDVPGQQVEFRTLGPGWERDEDGTRYWRNMEGQLHREDGPAAEGANGDKSWWIDDKLHREDGPAIEKANGSKYWYLEGRLHREDGPALAYVNGYEEWWLDGGRLSREEWKKATRKQGKDV